MKSKIVRYIRAESKMVAVGAGGGDVGRPHSKGTDFQLCDDLSVGALLCSMVTVLHRVPDVCWSRT